MDADRVPDDALLRRSVGGDNDAFADLMRRHEDRIFALAFRMTGDRSDALDATQDAFVSAFRQAAKFRGDAAVGTWLYRIAINSCRDLLRKKRRDPDALADHADYEPPATALGPEATTVLRVDLARALDAVGEDYREAVLMHDLGGLPYEEIAAATGVPIGTVKSRISRGRRRLAAILEQAGGAETSKEETKT